MMLRERLLICLLLLRFAHGGKARGERGRGKGSQHLMSFSGGILLIIKDANPVVPRIQILVPTRGPSGSGHSAILCVVTGLPGGIPEVTWSINHTPVQRRHTTVQAMRQTDGTRTANAILFLSARDWSPQHTYRCSITQDGKVYWAQAQPNSCWN